MACGQGTFPRGRGAKSTAAAPPHYRHATVACRCACARAELYTPMRREESLFCPSSTQCRAPIKGPQCLLSMPHHRPPFSSSISASPLFPCSTAALTIARPHRPHTFLPGRFRSNHPPWSSFPRHLRCPHPLEPPAAVSAPRRPTSSQRADARDLARPVRYSSGSLPVKTFFIPDHQQVAASRTLRALWTPAMGRFCVGWATLAGPQRPLLAGPGQATAHCACWAMRGFQPTSTVPRRKFFFYLSLFQLNSNFKNSYLNF
jgi:hypothetical protein